MIGKIYIVTDLGPGDGGKGGVVHKIVTSQKAKLVVKFGGGQGSHGIMTDDGEKFNFSHWGCGTLEGVPTAVAPSFVVIPHAILNEGEMLQHAGIYDPYDLLTVDPRAVCATPLHQIASHLNELMCKDHPRGTIGTGAGEAWRLRYRDDLTIRFDELDQAPLVRKKLVNLATHYRKRFAMIKDWPSYCLPADQEEAAYQMELLQDDEYIDWTLEQYVQLLETNINIQCLTSVLNYYDGTAVAECSHGVLTDAEVGFIPHVSAIRTVPNLIIETLRDEGFLGRYVKLGVTRAYAIRHGAGPLPTADDKMVNMLLPGSSKDENRMQGKVRVGVLDFNLLRYAIECCGSKFFNGICVTWMDQIQKNGVWKVCDQYDYNSKTGQVIPRIESMDVSKLSQSELAELCQKVFLEKLDVPVRMISFGPDDQNKLLLGGTTHGGEKGSENPGDDR